MAKRLIINADDYGLCADARPLFPDDEALKKIWPGLGGVEESRLRDEFHRASSISVGIADQRISATNDSGTVTFVRHYEVVIDGRTLPRESNVTMSVRRNGTTWIIERLTFEPRR